MTENCSSNTWLWRDPDKRWLNKVLDYIKASDPANNEIIILTCEDIKDIDTSIPLINYLFNLSSKFNLLGDERTMFLNMKDVLSSIELCLEQQKKANSTAGINIPDKEIVDYFNNYISCFKSENSDITDKLVTALREFMKQINCIDVWLLFEKCLNIKSNSDIIDHVGGYKYLLLGTPRSLILKQLIGILCEKEIFNISVETPLDVSLHSSPSILTSEKIVVVAESMMLEDVALNSQNELPFGSATEEYVEDIILSFLSLLLNSRNELALCKTMVSPIIDLSHQAFTALKHLSVEKDMPMCQVAISYVTRIRLGGKGYAPPSDCTMLPYLKGLELFVDTLNQLQTIIEEYSKPESAIKRLITALKKKLLKCNSDRIKESSVETVAKNLMVTLSKTSEIMKSTISKSTTQINQEALDVLYNFINFVNCNNFIHDPELALEKKHSKRTPLNLPPLLGYFRSPDEESSCDTKPSINDEDSVISVSSVVQQQRACPSYFHHSESSGVSATSCINSSTPSKTSFKGVLKETKDIDRSENTMKPPPLKSSENFQPKVIKRKSGKRSILSEITNDEVKSKDEGNARSKAKKPCKTAGNATKENIKSIKTHVKKDTKKVSKKFKQIEGQGKITNFFIMGKS